MTESLGGFITAIQIGKDIVDIATLIKRSKDILVSKINNVDIAFNIRDTVKVFCNDKYIVIVDIKGLIHEIKVYGVFGLNVTDYIDTKINDNTFTRKAGNITFTVVEGKIVNKHVNIKLEPIKPKKQSFGTGYKDKDKDLTINKQSIGTIDLETYEGIYYPNVYGLGYLTKRGRLNTFYISRNDLDYNILIIHCINSMLVSKYNGNTFFVHNFCNYDIGFILKVLTTANTIYNIYNINAIL